MAKSFKNLLDKMSPERRRRVEQRAMELREEMTLCELRRTLEITQEELAAALEKTQAGISKFERQRDLRVRTLEKFLKAMGGKLKIIAELEGREIVLNQFTDTLQEEDVPA